MTTPTIPNSPASELNWIKLEKPCARTYYYPDGGMFTVKEDVEYIAVKESSGGHSHRLVTTGGNSLYVSAGFVAISWPQEYQF